MIMNSYQDTPPAATNTTIMSPLSGNTINIAPEIDVLIINPAGTLLTLTVNLPSGVPDGKQVLICTSRILTTLTLGGGTIVGALTSMVLGGFCRFIYKASTDTWYRCG